MQQLMQQSGSIDKKICQGLPLRHICFALQIHTKTLHPWLEMLQLNHKNQFFLPRVDMRNSKIVFLPLNDEQVHRANKSGLQPTMYLGSKEIQLGAHLFGRR